MSSVYNERIAVDLGVARYPIFVGSEVRDPFAAYLRKASSARRVALVADEHTNDLFGLPIETALISQGFEVVPFTIEAGEGAKNWETAGRLLEALAEERIERTDLLVAVGGGVVSDLAGFVASVYKRGIPFALASTTLLSMVDAAVGGKTGVDLRAGKNLAGTFKQPIAIMADIDALASLPDLEYQSGLAEVVKTAFLDGSEMVDWCISHSEALNNRNTETLAQLVSQCMKFKALVVASDVEDHGMRECLNFGHTLGHAIEVLAGYGTIPHGHAVAEGMRFAARVSMQLLGTSRETVQQLDKLLDELQIARVTGDFKAAAVVQAMKSDKKVRDGDVRMVLLSEPGSWETMIVPDEVLYDHVRAWAAALER